MFAVSRIYFPITNCHIFNIAGFHEFLLELIVKIISPINKNSIDWYFMGTMILGDYGMSTDPTIGVIKIFEHFKLNAPEITILVRIAQNLNTGSV